MTCLLDWTHETQFQYKISPVNTTLEQLIPERSISATSIDRKIELFEYRRNFEILRFDVVDIGF